MKRFIHNEYVELSMHFRCNLKCEHCMIEGTMDKLIPESLEKLDQICALNYKEQRWKGLILTGAEITLRRDLPDLARKAKDNGFKHVRIQTHGMRLSNERYCRELVHSGIDEYFVSVTAANADTHDSITHVPGSFNKTIRGLENLDSYNDVVMLTNTVITHKNYKQVVDIVERLSYLNNLVQMEFWNYWPMSEVDDKNLIVSYQDILPYLKQAIKEIRKHGRTVEVKNFPECLLGELHDALNNDQPQLFIDPDFWTQFMRNGFHQCIYHKECASQQCLGLNTAYITKHGWHADELAPIKHKNNIGKAVCL